MRRIIIIMLLVCSVVRADQYTDLLQEIYNVVHGDSLNYNADNHYNLSIMNNNLNSLWNAVDLGNGAMYDRLYWIQHAAELSEGKLDNLLTELSYTHDSIQYGANPRLYDIDVASQSTTNLLRQILGALQGGGGGSSITNLSGDLVVPYSGNGDHNIITGYNWSKGLSVYADGMSQNYWQNNESSVLAALIQWGGAISVTGSLAGVNYGPILTNGPTSLDYSNNAAADDVAVTNVFVGHSEGYAWDSPDSSGFGHLVDASPHGGALLWDFSGGSGLGQLLTTGFGGMVNCDSRTGMPACLSGRLSWTDATNPVSLLALDVGSTSNGVADLVNWSSSPYPWSIAGTTTPWYDKPFRSIVGSFRSGSSNIVSGISGLLIGCNFVRVDRVTVPSSVYFQRDTPGGGTTTFMSADLVLDATKLVGDGKFLRSWSAYLAILWLLMMAMHVFEYAQGRA